MNNNKPEISNNEITLCEDIVFKYSKLGQPFFLRKNAKDCYNGISPIDWTPAELRKIADYIDANPNCKLFNDGSDY